MSFVFARRHCHSRILFLFTYAKIEYVSVRAYLSKTRIRTGTLRILEPWLSVSDVVEKTLTRMWADAQRDGRPAEYRWRPLRKFRNSIPCTMPRSLADVGRWSAVQ